MSDNNSFKRNKKRGMRFKPAGGFNRRSGRSGVKARLDVERLVKSQDRVVLISTKMVKQSFQLP